MVSEDHLGAKISHIFFFSKHPCKIGVRVIQGCGLYAYKYGKSKLSYRAEQGGLRWYGHMERMNDGRMTKRVMNSEAEGTRSRGRPKLEWMDGVTRSLHAREFYMRESSYSPSIGGASLTVTSHTSRPITVSCGCRQIGAADVCLFLFWWGIRLQLSFPDCQPSERVDVDFVLLPVVCYTTLSWEEVRRRLFSFLFGVRIH